MPVDLSKAISLLKSQKGYRESGTNHQKYSPNVPGLEWSQNQPWCQTMQSWVDLNAGGTPNKDFPLTASCWAATQWGKSRGRFSRTPRVGAYIMYGSSGQVHVDRIIEVHPGYLVAIGGNTSGSFGGSYWNGDGVYRKHVPRGSSRIYGYVMPVYGTPTGGSDEGDEVPDYRKYSTNGGQVIPPGQWTTVKWDDYQGEGAGNYWSVVFGPAAYNLTASLVLDGDDLPQGSEVQMRVAHYEKHGGANLPDGILRKGDKGAKVGKVQQWLDDHGYDLGKWGVDNHYGGATTKAMRAFQRDAGVNDDGVYGPNTEEAMEQESGAGSWEIKHEFAIGTPSVHAGGNCHVSCSLPMTSLDGIRTRIRVAQYSGQPVRIKSGEVHIHEWR